MKLQALAAFGFALIVWSSVLHRTARHLHRYVATQGDGWNQEDPRSIFSRIVGFVAGPPAFLTLSVCTIKLFGWQTLLIMPIGWVMAILLNALLRGGSVAQEVRRMALVRLPVSALAILVTGIFRSMQ